VPSFILSGAPLKTSAKFEKLLATASLSSAASLGRSAIEDGPSPTPCNDRLRAITLLAMCRSSRADAAANLAFRIHEKADRAARGAWQRDVVRAVERDPIAFAGSDQRVARGDDFGFVRAQMSRRLLQHNLTDVGCVHRRPAKSYAEKSVTA
jgi:hypothetical protein